MSHIVWLIIPLYPWLWRISSKALLQHSTDEKTESIPKTKRQKKNIVDQSAGGIISDNACGYATNTSSGPCVANSVISWPTITDIWPSTEKMMKPDISDVKLKPNFKLVMAQGTTDRLRATYLLIVAIKRVSRRIVLFCLLNDENVMSDPKPIPILLKICDVALTQTWMSFSFDQSPFPFSPRKYSIPSIAPVRVHPRINNAVSMIYGKIAVNQTIFPIDFVPRNTKKYIKTHVSMSKPKSSHLILPN